jgi:hypothetical protein
MKRGVSIEPFCIARRSKRKTHAASLTRRVVMKSATSKGLCESQWVAFWNSLKLDSSHPHPGTAEKLTKWTTGLKHGVSGMRFATTLNSC